MSSGFAEIAPAPVHQSSAGVATITSQDVTVGSEIGIEDRDDLRRSPRGAGMCQTVVDVAGLGCLPLTRLK